MNVNFSRLDEIRARRPVIHCVSNFVSANDCANLILALGASPIMAHAEEEVEEITALSAVTVLNTGTPDKARFALCRRWADAAQSAGKPLILDPVGAGASAWRLREVRGLLERRTPSVLRLNDGEARTLSDGRSGTRGLDCPGASGSIDRAEVARRLAREFHTVVFLSGAEDVIDDGTRRVAFRGGSARMAGVTGTGCMLSALCGAFAAAEPDMFHAAALASVFWKVCAALTDARTKGAGSFHAGLFDAASVLTSETLALEAGRLGFNAAAERP